MAQLVVRNLDEGVKTRLQRRAIRHGHSMEEEVRDILRNAVKPESSTAVALGSRIRSRFARIGLREDIPELRGHKPRPAIFKK
jgi:plasmid stability protein